MQNSYSRLFTYFLPYVIPSLFFFVFNCRARAQNLVPDSSFENNTAIPMDFSELGNSRSWSRASWGTPDLFCTCDRKTKMFSEKIYSQVNVPDNPMGSQTAHSGTCYAGIFAFSHGSYREYIQTPLLAPLEKSKYYLFSMYISLADYSPAYIDQMGVCFSDDKAAYNSPNVINDLEPAYIHIEKEVGKDVEEWHKVSVLYKARGGEKHLLIGSFEVNRITKTKLKVPKEIKTRLEQRKGRDAYYFIDDVSLVETDLTDPADTIKNTTPTDTISTSRTFVLQHVLFQTNKTTLTAASCPELDSLASYLISNPDLILTIAGHTDNTGNSKANKKLSLGRAKAVAGYLLSKGLDKARISYTGYGSEKPIATNETEGGRKENRRVEFTLTKP